MRPDSICHRRAFSQSRWNFCRVIGFRCPSFPYLREETQRKNMLGIYILNDLRLHSFATIQSQLPYQMFMSSFEIHIIHFNFRCIIKPSSLCCTFITSCSNWANLCTANAKVAELRMYYWAQVLKRRSQVLSNILVSDWEFIVSIGAGNRSWGLQSRHCWKNVQKSTIIGKKIL